MSLHFDALRQKSIILIAAFLLACSACRQSAPTIRYLVPDGFRGAFVIRVNRPDGRMFEQKDGRLIVVIPKSGELSVKTDPFSNWHSEERLFADGTTIPDGHLSKPALNEIAWWSLGRTNNSEDWFFIGTEDEKNSYVKRTGIGLRPELGQVILNSAKDKQQGMPR